jgi:CRP-like cAMP-binding protein
VPLSDAEWARFTDLLRPRRVRRGAHLVRAGERVRTLSFVVAGVLRRYYVAERGEVTTGFLAEHSFATDYPALCSDAPSESSLQALTDACVLSVDVAGLRWLSRGDAVWHDLAPAAGLALARRRERRHVELLTRSPAERYRDLVRQCPTLMDRVPHYHVASYLGITPESLSRLRRRQESGAPSDVP